ncbi:hypothetical protein JG687_00002489 [Phytophthora cactorum]|uniref:RXLR phytopathogen effector protein WY-domain domain-containing protein n=1 Tax=Phytophthora cactorum TaxID=29920 RepID=A0A8T1UY59_9STRA|nr:hypothetical protein JG687_00002489 [Phytophthora cactorum]
MGCPVIVLLAVVAFLAGVLAHDFPDQAYNSKMIAHYVPVVSNSLPKSTITTASKRLLRSYEAEVSGDERVNVPGLSKLDDLVQKILKSKPSTEKAVVKAIVAAYRAKNGDQAFSDLDIYYLLLKTNSAQDLTTLFRSLKDSPGLEKIAAKAGTKLDETPIFRQWQKYVETYRAKNAVTSFTDFDMFVLLQKTMPDENMVTLLHSLRKTPVMKDHADNMQRILFMMSKTSHKTMNTVWLQSRETPEEVFKILRLAKAPMGAFDETPELVQWLRYIKMYRDHIKESVFSDAQIVRFLTEAKPLRSGWEFATLFQSLKDVPDLKKLAENMQTYQFRDLLRMKISPEIVTRMLANTDVVRLPKNDHRYTWEAYILYYAERRGGETMLEKVKTFFTNDNPVDALTAVTKLQ